MPSIYRTYLRDFSGSVSEKSVTHNRDAAEAAFADLVNRPLDGQKLAAVLSYNNSQLAFHRFDRSPGDSDYWRDKLDAIPWPTAGRPAELSGGRRVQVYLDAASLDAAAKLGDGNVSEGIRKALLRP